MSQKEREVILAAFVGLDDLIEQYRQAVFWLILGDHNATSRSTEHAMRVRLKEMKGKIIGLLEEIETKTQ